ncbi:MAG TPA: VWA domain-containing protein [Firmicutes bacterium]|nr:VWA domain-containing protein [Bacillota bacterium]
MKWANAELLPVVLIIAVIFVLLVLLRFLFPGKVNYSNFRALKKTAFKKFNFMVLLPDILKIAGIILLGTALLRPQGELKDTTETVSGIDIILALDLSGSMRADDFKPNRLAAAKDVLKKFVKGIKNDRVGMVVFAGLAFTQCPLTVDYEIVESLIDEVDFTTVRVDGTAIGDAIITSVNRLDISDREKVIILATDGVNNRGIDPLEAAKVAAVKNVKIYTIGIGKEGGAPAVYTDALGNKRYHTDRRGNIIMHEEPDDEVLTNIAQMTGGMYFRAEDKRALERIYSRISELEKRDIEVRTYKNYEDKFINFLWAGIILLVIALALEVLWLARILV